MMNTKFVTCSFCSLITLAGTTRAADEPSLTSLEASHGNVRHAAHIYFNAVTGERVVTLTQNDQVVGAESINPSSGPIWASDNPSPCAAFGYNTAFFFGVSNPDPSDPLADAITILDIGDIAKDTVVDCFQVNWVTAHPDNDFDSDSVGDGVEELAGRWMVWDADNGFETNQSTRLSLVDVLLFNLPGNIFGEGSLTGYTLDVDLAAFGTATDLSFEIGDSDGDCQTATFCNSSVDYDSDSIPDGPISLGDRDFDGMLDSDLDGDGLFDWAWTVQFIQPGTGNDFDSDSDTGSAAPTASDTIGVGFGVPAGEAVDNGDGTWSYIIDPDANPPGAGHEDRITAISVDMDGKLVYEVGNILGGFACEGGPLDQGGSGYTPLAMLSFVLYGPTDDIIIDCSADLNGDEQLDFFDVSLFIQGYQLGEDYNGDGSTSFFDVSQFIQDYNAGCP